MNNKQIIAAYDRLTYVNDPLFGFIHPPRHDFFDRLRLGIFKLKFNFYAPIWQTATFREVAYGLADQFTINLKNGEKIDENWKKDSQLEAFIHAKYRQFFSCQESRKDTNASYCDKRFRSEV